MRAYLILRPVYGNINAREQDICNELGIFARTAHIHFKSLIIYPLSQHEMHVCAALKRVRATENHSLSVPSIADLLYSIARALN